MNTRFFKLFVLIIFSGSYTFAQQADTITYAEGRILHAETKEPIKARITYQSLPYGSRIGTINNSQYSFPMYDNDHYSITVEAEGFSPAKYMLDPAEANDQNKIIKDIELSAGSPRTNHNVGHVMRLNNLIFELGKSKISPDSYSELDIVVNMMKENETMVIQLEGHTDYQGNPKDNMKLSQQRVDAVKSYITSRGVQRSRVKTKAFGGTMPISKDDTPQAHSMNRRVELRILEN